jgi:hypothetical protein
VYHLIPLRPVLGFGNIQLELYTRVKRGQMERMPRENCTLDLPAWRVEEFIRGYISH